MQDSTSSIVEAPTSTGTRDGASSSGGTELAKNGPPAPAGAPSAIAALVDRLADDMARRWHAGDPVLVEAYLARYPELVRQADAAAELIYEELCLRQEYQEEQTAKELFGRFPDWRDQLDVLLKCHDFLKPAARAYFPGAGETFGGFRLLAELGRGAHGRVFVATQTALADRPVVLKLAPRSGQEHLSLARLQHTHIVPLYSVEDNPAGDLRALCMPYFGGASLARLLELMQPQPLEERTGGHVLEALKQAQAAAPLRIPVEGPACQFLAKVSYSRAICWLGTCLAEALQYTHERGLVHLDIKPSNVLWAADGQPMLLDLHLARAPIMAGSPGPAWLGGTPAYMAPEQRAAMAAIEKGHATLEPVDGRADIYSLGLLLIEALAGSLPPEHHDTRAWLPQRNAQVSPGLVESLARCLQADPPNRYQDAAALADDLRRHLVDQAVRTSAGARRGRQARSGRFGYRPVLIGLGAAVLVAVGMAGLYLGMQAFQAHAALAEGLEHQRRGDAVAAQEAWRRGLALAAASPFEGALAEDLHTKLRLAERAAAVAELHLLAERLRLLLGTDDRLPAARGSATAPAILGHCKIIWDSRALIVQRLGTEPSELGPVQNDLLDLALLWTHVAIQWAGKDETDARQAALVILSQAEALFGPHSALDCEREAHLKALGLVSIARQVKRTPRNAWEHFAIGRTHLQNGRLDDARAQFDRALALAPQDFWAQFLKGKAAFLLKNYDDAVLAFTACVTLAPRKAWCYYNRGLAFEALGDTLRAAHDYSRALELDQTLALAAVNRGMLHYHARRYGEAREDLARALAAGAGPALVHYDRALVYLAEGNRAAAHVDLQETLRYEPGHAEARRLLERMNGE